MYPFTVKQNALSRTMVAEASLLSCSKASTRDERLTVRSGSKPSLQYNGDRCLCTPFSTGGSGNNAGLS